MSKKKDGAVYKTCIYCGLKWNVSVKDKYDFYVCPVCRAKKNIKTNIRHKLTQRRAEHGYSNDLL